MLTDMLHQEPPDSADEIYEAIPEDREPASGAAQRDFLNVLMTHGPLAIVVLDRHDRVMTANAAFARLARVPLSEIEGKSLTGLLKVDAEREALKRFLEAIPLGGRLVEELQLSPASGAPRWARLTGTRADGSSEGMTIILGDDVTENIEARDAMVAAQATAEQAMRSKSSFLAAMSHEIRTPMNGIIGMIGILLDTPLNEQQRNAARIVKRSADGLLRILNDILDVSKIEAGQLDLEEADINLPGLVEDVARIYMPTATSKGTELIVDVGGFLHSHFVGDSTRITQVLNNLLSNAIKFTQGGEIILIALPVGDHHPDLNETVSVRFSVRDSGIGIPAEKLDKIFNEFEQADQSTTRVYGGTGLGLSISRRLVEMMGGELHVNSEVGQGSEFHFQLTLPIAETPRGERAEVRAQLGGRRFLVVDDNDAARQIVINVLEKGGAAVDQATNVAGGLAMLAEASGSASPYDAVILDHLMPRQDGFDFAEAAKLDPASAQCPILMLTSSHGAGELAQARDLGIAGFLSKPVRGPDLIRALGTVLGREDFDGPERRIVTRATLEREGGLHILVAEDNPVNQQVALALLKNRGHEVDIVENGRLAVEAVLSTPYDMVLMDVQMPEMDGLEATREIRTYPQFASLPILALTAHAFSEQRDLCAEAGMDDFLAKPIQPAALYHTLEKWEGRLKRNAVEFDSPSDTSEGPEESTPYEAQPAAPVNIPAFRAVMMEAGIESIVEPTLDVFMNETPKIFDRLMAAVEASDASGVNAGAHSLKSSSANIRAEKLAKLFAELEMAGRDEDLKEIAELLPRVESEYGAVLSFLGQRK
jgi:two-component system, sensor histidine kinase and response regulator